MVSEGEDDMAKIRVRAAGDGDVAGMAALAAAKRAAYAKVLPVFWRPAAEADAMHAAWFAHLVEEEAVIALVVEGAHGLDGFAVAALAPAPPVYDPGGPTLLIDDFCVRDASLWPTVGAALLGEARARGQDRGAAQLVVICGAHDAEKRALAEREGLAAASLWYTKPIQPPPATSPPPK